MEGGDPIDVEIGVELAAEVREDGFSHDSSSAQAARNGAISEETPLLQGIGTQEENNIRASQKGSWSRLLKKPKPSAYLLLPLFFLIAVNLGACIAPRIQIYTELVCRDFYHRDFMLRQSKNHVASLEPECGLVGNGTYYNDFSQDGNRIERQSLYLWQQIDIFVEHRSVPTSIVYNVKPPPATFCRQARVQSQVTKLSLTLTLITGVLGSLITSWWASMSDIKGRVWVIKYGVWGSIAADITLLSVVYFAPVVRGYWFMVIGAIIDGFFGGFTAASAAFHAYISDCVPARERVGFFSTMIATFFIGLAIGPTLGAYIIDFAGDIIIVFWIAVVFHLAFFFIANFILPESLSKETREKVAQKRADEMRAKAESELSTSRSRMTSSASTQLAFVVRKTRLTIQNALRPAVEFLPRKRSDGSRYWDMFLISIVYVILYLMMGLYSINLIYVSGQFGWSALYQGYFVSGMSALRVFHLLVVLPTVIKLFKPKESVRPGQTRTDADLPPMPTGIRRLSSVLNLQGYKRLRNRNTSVPSQTMRDGGSTLSNRPAEIIEEAEITSGIEAAEFSNSAGGVQSTEAEMHFDLYLARVSVIIEVIGYFLMANAASDRIFVVGAMILTFSSAASPAVQAIALAFSDHHSTGKLMAGLSVLQGMSSIIAPLLFGGVFSYSVGTWPTLVYHVAWFLLVTAAVALFCIRLRDTDVQERRHTFSQ